MEKQVFVVMDPLGRPMYTTEDESVAMAAWEQGYTVSQFTPDPEPDFR